MSLIPEFGRHQDQIQDIHVSITVNISVHLVRRSVSRCEFPQAHLFVGTPAGKHLSVGTEYNRYGIPYILNERFFVLTGLYQRNFTISNGKCCPIWTERNKPDLIRVPFKSGDMVWFGSSDG